MKINKVKIKNYRQYRDVEIDFSKGEKNFTVIQGNNGTGKTTLLNALSWCLYGEETHDYGDNAVMSYCNNKTAFLAEEGEKIEVSVDIEFDDEGEILTFQRKNHYTKHNSKLTRDLGAIFRVFKQEGNDIKTLTDDAYIIDQKIPREIERYFFFDGGLLGDYFNEKSTEHIKNSILELSQINLISNIDKNINSVINKYNKDLKKIAPKLGEASINLMECVNNISKYEKEISETAISNRILEEDIIKIEDELLDKNSKDITNLVEEDKTLENEIKVLSKKLKVSESKRKKFIIKNYPILLSYDYLVKFLELSEESRKKGTIPPLFEKRFIKDLLEDGICICGIDLESNNSSKKHLEKVLNNTSDITDMASDITKAVVHIEDLISTIKDFKKNIIHIKQKIKYQESELNEKLEKRRNISSSLKLNPIEEISKLQTKKEDMQKIRDQNIRKITSLEHEIKTLTKDKKTYEYQTTKEEKLDQEVILLEKKVNLAKETKNAVEIISKEFSNNIHKNIEERTKEKFVKIQWKEDEFVDIKIDDDYRVHIKNKLEDYERPGDLSDGEKMCLGLCFMSALHNISGFELPIIMDTPLGNLDKDIRQNIAKFLPEFVNDDQQVVLLVTGTEYTEDFREILSKHVGKEYLIKWDNSDEGKESKVILNG